MPAFIGRKYELDSLKQVANRPSASLVVVRGRRRIGKSRLVEQLAEELQDYQFYSLVGLPPAEGTTAQGQRDEFVQQLARQTGLPKVYSDDWLDLFQLLAERAHSGKVLLLFDEISWIGSKDPQFLGKLKTAWDTLFKRNNQLLFVLCGSASSWIEKNILSSTGFLGRVAYSLNLQELPIRDCALFWQNRQAHISAYEIYKVLSVTGGIPRYLEEINPQITAEDNIQQLCFTPGGLLVDEFRQIFANIFTHDTRMYERIVRNLIKGPIEPKAIAEQTQFQQSGLLTDYLNELELGGFVSRDYLWDLKTGNQKRLSLVRLKDNYLRFYLKYIEPKANQIHKHGLKQQVLSHLPAWHTVLGLQFENLVINNVDYIYDQLGLAYDHIVGANSYFQRPTKNQQGCQIDLLIQDCFQTLYVCEIKFSKSPLGCSVINELKDKINALKKPRYLSCRPVLIHMNGVSQELQRQAYFAHMIDMSQAFF